MTKHLLCNIRKWKYNLNLCLILIHVPLINLDPDSEGPCLTSDRETLRSDNRNIQVPSETL